MSDTKTAVITCRLCEDEITKDADGDWLNSRGSEWCPDSDDCDYCESGAVDCGECNGEGCDDEGDECEYCDAEGSLDCDECGGTGSVDGDHEPKEDD